MFSRKTNKSPDYAHHPLPQTTVSQLGNDFAPAPFLTVPSPSAPLFPSDTPGRLSSSSSRSNQSLLLSKSDPFARVFPRPPTDTGREPPFIRAGSVRRSTTPTPTRSPTPRSPLPSDDHPFIMSHSFEQSRDAARKKTPTSPSSPPADIHLEIGESADRVGALSSASDSVGVIGSFDKRLNRSVMSLGAKVKAEKVLGADPQPRLASLYLVSGLGKVSKPQGSPCCSDLTFGRNPPNGRYLTRMPH